jgi:lysozyme
MGRVDGIEGDVDLNVLQGGQQTLAELFAPSAQPSPSP